MAIPPNQKKTSPVLAPNPTVATPKNRRPQAPAAPKPTPVSQPKPAMASALKPKPKPKKTSTAKPSPRSSSPSPAAMDTQPQQAPIPGHPTHAVNINVQTGASPKGGMTSAGQAVAHHGTPAGAPSSMPAPTDQQPQTTAPGPATPTSSKPAQPKVTKQQLPKQPPKAPKAPKDVQQARRQQSTVLKARQSRETQGKMRGPVRETDAGGGYYPPLYPTL